MNEPNTNSVTCQDPIAAFTTFTPPFSKDRPLEKSAPSRHMIMKMTGKVQTKENCRHPNSCGVSPLKGKDNHRGCFENTVDYLCHEHSCPASRAELTRKWGRIIGQWPNRHWREVSDGTKWDTLRDKLTDWHMQYFGIPTDHGTVLVVTPEPIDGSQPYTGGWYNLATLIQNMPPEARLRIPHQTKETTEKTEQEVIGVNASEGSPMACEVEEEQMQGIPLVPRDTGKQYLLYQWTEVDQAYMFAKAGFQVALGTRGGVRIYFRDPYEAGEIERMLSDLSHAEPELVHQIEEEVMQQLRSPELAEWKEVARQIQEYDRRARKYDQ